MVRAVVLVQTSLLWVPGLCEGLGLCFRGLGLRGCVFQHLALQLQSLRCSRSVAAQRLVYRARDRIIDLLCTIGAKLITYTIWFLIRIISRMGPNTLF